VVNRVLRDDPSKGDMHNRQAVTPRRLWNAAKDYDLWPLYAIGLVAYIPQSPVNTYITLTLKSVGFSTFNTNLLTIPSSAAHIITLLLITRLSEWTNERTLVSMLQPIWTLPCLIALRFWPGSLHQAWGTYALVSVLLSYPYCHAILVAVSSPPPPPPLHQPTLNLHFLLTVDVQKLQQRRRTLCIRSFIQHVRPTRQHLRQLHLSHRRQASLPSWQPQPDHYQLIEY
jgi:hypothetical protein